MPWGNMLVSTQQPTTRSQTAHALNSLDLPGNMLVSTQQQTTRSQTAHALNSLDLPVLLDGERHNLTSDALGKYARVNPTTNYCSQTAHALNSLDLPVLLDVMPWGNMLVSTQQPTTRSQTAHALNSLDLPGNMLVSTQQPTTRTQTAHALISLDLPVLHDGERHNLTCDVLGKYARVNPKTNHSLTKHPCPELSWSSGAGFW
ncbi:hypothetical protein J6590_041513 [Homalodisca vitripennis]|nr:hypothetical protein J6590_041513 [Homalodisca vitripennis]